MLRIAAANISIGSRVATRGFRTTAMTCGGARPGGVPTFNWKQRKQLGLDLPKQPEEMKLEYFGDYEDLMKDERYKGGTFVDVPSEGTFEYTQGKVDEPDRQRKVINVAMLYGANKPTGPAVLEKKRERFSHKRVFGHKSAEQ